MSKRPRRNHSPLFKAKVAVDAIRGEKTLAEMAELHDVHPNQIVDWKNQLLERAASVFGAPEAVQRIDALNLAHPFAGSRMLRDMLNREGFGVARRHVSTLMQRMGIEALYRKPNTSRKHPTHQVYPYLLRELKIDRANQVWAADITYIPMASGWVYLCAVVDWASRRVLSHRVSISMDASFCKGAWRDNIFVERFWRSIKYEEIYLHAYDSVSQAKAGIARYIDFYNTARPHSSLDKQTPQEFYFATLPAIKPAA